MTASGVSKHSKKIKRQEMIAKGILRFFASLTILILIIIVGYILYRGVVSDRTIEYNVVNTGQQDIILENDAYSVIVNHDVRIDELTMESVMELFGGTRKDWGKISEQDLEVSAVFYNENSPEYQILIPLIFAGDQDKLARKVVLVDDAVAVVNHVNQTSGAVGIIPSSLKGQLPENVKVVDVRRISMIVNEDVTAVKDNVRLRFLNENHIRAIYSGEDKNWLDVNGNNTPITVVAMQDDSAIGKSFNELLLSEVEIASNIVYVDSTEAMIETVRNTLGAIGYAYFDEAVAQDAVIVSVERHEVKQNLNWRFIVEPPKNSGQVGGISTIILNTIFMVAMVLLVSVPIGLSAAVYLTEYAKQGRLVRILRFGTETLAGIPSIIFGLFGFMFFCIYLDLGVGLIGGTLTLTLMIMPTIIRTAEEAIKTVPLAYREGSLAIGATKWQTIRKVVLPAASPGILTGVILAIGRAIGETAAIIFTMGSDYRLADSLSSSARVLSVHLYFLVKEGISFEKAFATATVLIVVILAINFTANKLITRMGKMQG
jgi:phosphate transport system permease protein